MARKLNRNLTAAQKTSYMCFFTYGVVILIYLMMQGLISSGSITSSLKGMLIPICAYIVMAVSLNLTVGILGELSLGHAGFMSVGAFTGVTAAVALQDVVSSNALRLLIAERLAGLAAKGSEESGDVTERQASRLELAANALAGADANDPVLAANALRRAAQTASGREELITMLTGNRYPAARISRLCAYALTYPQKSRILWTTGRGRRCAFARPCCGTSSRRCGG